MVQKQGRMLPPVAHWFEDQPDGNVPARGLPSACGNLRHIDANYLEISRTETLMRGVGIWAGCFSLAAYLYFLFSTHFDFWSMVLLALAHVLVLFALFFFRLDTRVPSDTPVRFNRAAGKVYAYEFKWKPNPLVRWPQSIKVFDWAHVHAEITRQAGNSGTTYAVRYALFISHCKPGTLEVLDRIQLGGNTLDEGDMRRLWDYCRLYMLQGPDAVPPQTPRLDDVSFRRCFFFFMPFLDPTEEGRAYRKQMHTLEWIASIALMVPVFWLLLPLGLMRYVALKLAPRATWPAVLDVESRGAFTSGPLTIS